MFFSSLFGYIPLWQSEYCNQVFFIFFTLFVIAQWSRNAIMEEEHCHKLGANTLWPFRDRDLLICTCKVWAMRIWYLHSVIFFSKYLWILYLLPTCDHITKCWKQFFSQNISFSEWPAIALQRKRYLLFYSRFWITHRWHLFFFFHSFQTLSLSLSLSLCCSPCLSFSISSSPFLCLSHSHRHVHHILVK